MVAVEENEAPVLHVAVLLTVAVAVGEREGERVREPLAVGVAVADATVATMRTPWFA